MKYDAAETERKRARGLTRVDNRALLWGSCAHRRQNVHSISEIADGLIAISVGFWRNGDHPADVPGGHLLHLNCG